MELYRKEITYILMALMFIVAPFYYKPNLAGTGFNIPYNIAVWGVAVTIIFYSLLLSLSTQKFIYYDKVWMLFVFPALIVLSSFLSGYMNANDWILKQVYVFWGLIFILSLFQLRLDNTEIENILLIIGLSMIIHAGLGVLQNIGSPALQNFAPPKAGGRPTGILQQINVQASYLATGILIILFLLSRGSIKNRGVITKLLMITSVFLSSYILSNSGSRIGIISCVIGLLSLTVAYRKEYFNKTS